MGANATTSVPTYVANEVLTAADLNVTNSGIPVFATTITRDAAFGGTGEKTLAEGQFAYIEATNTTQYYDGAAWQAVGASGLTYLTGGSFTTVAAVSLTTGTFSATYRNYLININITANTVDSNPLHWRGRTTGTDNSNANYAYGFRGARFDTGTATSGGYGTGLTSGRLTFLPSPFTTGSVHATFFAPFSTAPTSYVSHATGRGVSDPEAALYGAGYFSSSTSFDSLSFYVGSGTISGTYEVYGYAIS
jgi:hypothetical protein